MITSLLGFFVLIFSVMRDEGVSVAGIIAGVVMILLGLLFIDASHENAKARNNYRRYWAYGELPGQDRNRK